MGNARFEGFLVELAGKAGEGRVAGDDRIDRGAGHIDADRAGILFERGDIGQFLDRAFEATGFDILLHRQAGILLLCLSKTAVELAAKIVDRDCLVADLGDIARADIDAATQIHVGDITDRKGQRHHRQQDQRDDDADFGSDEAADEGDHGGAEIPGATAGGHRRAALGKRGRGFKSAQAR